MNRTVHVIVVATFRRVDDSFMAGKVVDAFEELNRQAFFVDGAFCNLREWTASNGIVFRLAVQEDEEPDGLTMKLPKHLTYRAPK